MCGQSKKVKALLPKLCSMSSSSLPSHGVSLSHAATSHRTRFFSSWCALVVQHHVLIIQNRRCLSHLYFLFVVERKNAHDDDCYRKHVPSLLNQFTIFDPIPSPSPFLRSRAV